MGEKMEQRKIESETQAYKLLMRVAKKLRYLEYGKWQITPDVHEPLRKFTVEKDFEWAKIKLLLYSQQYRKRNWNEDYDSAYAWRYLIGIQGLFRNSNGDIICKTGLLVKPRMVKKLLTYINETVIPNFYQEIESIRQEFEEKIVTNRLFVENMQKLKGLVTMEPHRYNGSKYVASMPDDPTIKWRGVTTSDIILDKDTVSMSLELTYDSAKKILEVLRG